MADLVMVGSGGFAREVAWMVHEINKAYQDPKRPEPRFRILGCIASTGAKTLSTVMGEIPILGNDAWALANLPAETHYVIAIGNPALRKKIAAQYDERGFRALSLAHPSAEKSFSVKMGIGGILCAKSILTVDISIGKHCIVNLGSTIGHDCILGDFVTIAPGCHLSGNVKIGNGCELGTGTIVLPGIEIGEGSILGAGSVVTENIPAGVVAAGVPAKVSRGKES